jgi:hypothetical protein
MCHTQAVHIFTSTWNVHGLKCLPHPSKRVLEHWIPRRGYDLYARKLLQHCTRSAGAYVKGARLRNNWSFGEARTALAGVGMASPATLKANMRYYLLD